MVVPRPGTEVDAEGNDARDHAGNQQQRVADQPRANLALARTGLHRLLALVVVRTAVVGLLSTGNGCATLAHRGHSALGLLNPFEKSWCCNPYWAGHV